MARHDAHLVVRLPDGNRRLIDRAAERRGQTRSGFIRQTLTREAVEVVTEGEREELAEN